MARLCQKLALISQSRGVERASGVLGMPCLGTRHGGRAIT